MYRIYNNEGVPVKKFNPNLFKTKPVVIQPNPFL